MIRLTVAALTVLMLGMGGCVERKLVINSDPPGAPVWVDEVFVGATPLEHPFVHYGSRRIRVGPIRDENGKVAYHEEEGVLDVKAPYYEVIPLDFIFECIIPTVYVDEHKVPLFELKPAGPEGELTPDEANRLVEEAEEFRRKALTSIPEVTAEEGRPAARPVEAEAGLREEPLPPEDSAPTDTTLNTSGTGR
jgi:hypothetical protein